MNLAAHTYRQKALMLDKHDVWLVSKDPSVTMRLGTVRGFGHKAVGRLPVAATLLRGAGVRRVCAKRSLKPPDV